MLKARKANRVLKIPDEKKKTYIALGYTITDMDGNMIHEHVEPSEKLEQAEKEIQDLKAKLEEASKYAENADKKIQELEKKNTEAEKEIQDLKAKLEEASKYAENADKKIQELEKKNTEAEKEIQDLKAQIASAGATEQVATPAPETKKTTKASSKAEK